MSESSDLILFDVTSADQKALSAGNMEAFDDLLSGISAGAPPRIKAQLGKFRLVVGGEETAIPTKQLVEGEYLPVVILGAKRDFNKTYYAEAYDPADEPDAPDCWSLDAVKPDPSIQNPISKSCAGCPMNQFGSGRNASNQPTKGKACVDTKIIAVAYKGGVYQLRITPASLKSFGAYIRALKERAVSPGNVVTYIGIQDDMDYTVLTFLAGARVPEKNIPQLAELSGSEEVKAITNPTFSAPALPAPNTQEQDEGDTEAAEQEEKDARAKQAAADRQEAVDRKAAASKKAAATKKAKAEAAAKAKADEAKAEADGNSEGGGGGIPSDDELNHILGL